MKLILMSKGLCASLPLSPLWCNFQNKACAEPLTSLMISPLYIVQLACAEYVLHNSTTMWVITFFSARSPALIIHAPFSFSLLLPIPLFLPSSRTFPLMLWFGRFQIGSSCSDSLPIVSNVPCAHFGPSFLPLQPSSLPRIRIRHPAVLLLGLWTSNR